MKNNKQRFGQKCNNTSKFLHFRFLHLKGGELNKSVPTSGFSHKHFAPKHLSLSRTYTLSLSHFVLLWRTAQKSFSSKISCAAKPPTVLPHLIIRDVNGAEKKAADLLLRWVNGPEEQRLLGATVEADSRFLCDFTITVNSVWRWFFRWDTVQVRYLEYDDDHYGSSGPVSPHFMHIFRKKYVDGRKC